ncbi:hypothetical protein R0137_12255 [Congregibacter brevis]|uniref:DUF1049 domain-containing protein n=1 Tax=Congregibacter brevis TaxID=3081201 RepID=A0ABZ0I918_9GAMM|nr:hypothetical protein R0137_12255 [Congregibacter sp. IMCC45268]
MKFPFWRRSLARTTFLGVAALGVLLWAASTQLGLGVNSLVAQLLVLLLAMLLLIGVAALVAVLLGLLRRRR